jgi:hypothetical protein
MNPLKRCGGLTIRVDTNEIDETGEVQPDGGGEKRGSRARERPKLTRTPSWLLCGAMSLLAAPAGELWRTFAHGEVVGEQAKHGRTRGRTHRGT